MNKKTGKPMIWIYHNQERNREARGDATVTYEDPAISRNAIQMFNGLLLFWLQVILFYFCYIFFSFLSFFLQYKIFLF